MKKRLSLLLAAPPGEGQLICDCAGSAAVNRRCLGSDQNVFVARPGGVLVQFTCGPARAISYEGATAFAAALPERVTRLQRREFFRIETPKARPLSTFARLPTGSLLNLPAHDISCNGMGLQASNLGSVVQPGLALPNLRFLLPEDDKDIFCEAVVRHVTLLSERAGTTQHRIGLEFQKLSRADEHRIQRYIARVEHERHELS